MQGNSKPGTDMKKLWQQLHASEQRLVSYLVHATPPVSIDTLSVLAEIPAVKVLNVMEVLRKKKVVCEKKEHGKGIYFLNDTEAADFVRKQISEEETGKILRAILDHYRQSLDEGPEKTLVIAELYRKLGDTGDGLSHIKNAADILYRSGQKEKATYYYSYLLENFSEKNELSADADSFLDNTLEKFLVPDHFLPVDRQVLLLTKLQKIAKRCGKWDATAKIDLLLGQILKASGQYERASQHFTDSWKIAEGMDDQHMLRMTALSLSDFLFWEGRVSEAVGRYEKTVGNLEEFGDDESALKASAMLGWSYAICGRLSRGMGMIEAVRSKAESLRFQGVVVYADLMSALSLIEARKTGEAEVYAKRVLSAPAHILDPYLLSAVNGCMAYIHCVKEEYEKAFECQKKVLEYDRALGSVHHKGSHVLSSLNKLEKKGFRHEEINCDLEIERVLSGNDIHMKGVAFRYRALRNIGRRQSKGRAFLDLKNSEKYLKQAGADIELARTWVVLGDAFLKEGEIRVAQSYLEKAWALFSKVDKGLFPRDLLVIMMPQEQKIGFMIERIIDINESLGTIRDMSSFLERVINVTMDFTMAMRGAFFILEPGSPPKTIASRNLDPLMLKAEQFSLIKEVIAGVAKRGEEVIMPGASEENTVSDRRLIETGISALICMPAKLGEYTHGYLYLDNPLGGKPFSENHLPYIRLICNQIAVGLSNIRMYEEMKTLKDRFEDEAIFYKKEMGIANPSETIIGQSEGIKRVIGQIRQVASTDSSVLIIGETGVGKELVAKAIHNASERKDGPFIPVNLAALPQELVASELFGHEKGAFTGAHERYKGRFELAHGGTIFLDEIGDLPLNVQVKLLRVLQEGIFERLGSAKPIQSKFRVIAATHKDLSREVGQGTFREDLYYRLNVFPIRIPPLRERREDILPISEHFLDKACKRMGKRIRRIPGEELKKLTDYHWPGNVRELEHFIERAVILSDGEKISFSGLDHTFGSQLAGEETGAVSLVDLEREHIQKVLRRTHWKVSGPNGAALVLGLKPTTLLSRMKKLGIKKPSVA